MSNNEITRVMRLARRTPRSSVATAAEWASPVLPPTVCEAGASSLTAGQDREFRLTRVRCLRRMLADGAYAVTADQVAGKMIGRAICDQVSRLFDD